MNEKSVKSNTTVALIKEETQKKSLVEGIKKLDGMSNFIKEGDTVFIKITLRIPEAYPVNTNFDVLSELIKICKKAGAKKVLVGSFPDEKIDMKSLSESLELKSYIESLNAELVFLNFSKPISFEVNGKSIELPFEIINADKYIILNQVSVDPLFMLTLSILNSYSSVSHKYQHIEKVERKGKDYLLLDQYKQDLITNILDVYTLRKPDLVINDLYYIIESAGPYLYKDSKLRNTGMMVVGTDSLAVDIITLKLFKQDFMKNQLIAEAHNRKLGDSDLSNISLKGIPLEDNAIDLNPCVSKLEDINLLNTTILRGKYCSGCYQGAYRLLNFMKTNLIKDLKYIGLNSFLIGENPKEPKSLQNLFIYGDCAINSTKNRDFRKIKIQSDKNLLEALKNNIKKGKAKPKKEKIKEKVNKSILEFPGCPPNFYDCLNSLLKFYGKSTVPSTNFFNEIFSNSYLEKINNTKRKYSGDDK